MKQKQKELLLLIFALNQLKDLGVEPKDVISNYDKDRVEKMISVYFPTGRPNMDALKMLAQKAYASLDKK